MPDLSSAFAAIRKSVGDASAGLPQEVFEFVSTLTPMINVDLLVQDEQGKTLLTWRDDPHFDKGWHVPGGIIRFREDRATRILKVAETELGTEVEFDPAPIAVAEIIDHDRELRGHFISLLFRCSLKSAPNPDTRFDADAPKAGAWEWHTHCPEDILPVHKIYCPFMR